MATLEERIKDGLDAVAEQIKEAVPTGGTTGQVLQKASDSDYATEWADPAGGGGGVSQAEVIAYSIIFG